jgi:hypothetical protein
VPVGVAEGYLRGQIAACPTCGDVRLLDEHGLHAPSEGLVLLDVHPVLFERRGSNAVQLAASLDRNQVGAKETWERAAATCSSDVECRLTSMGFSRLAASMAPSAGVGASGVIRISYQQGLKNTHALLGAHLTCLSGADD